MNEPGYYLGKPKNSPNYFHCAFCGRFMRRPQRDQAQATFITLCDLMGVTPEQLRAEDRRQSMSTVRHVILAAMRKVEPRTSYPILAQLIGRDHSTAIHSCKVARPVLVDDLVRRFRQVQGHGQRRTA